MPEEDMAAAAASARSLMQVTALTRWVASGRRLTQTGQLTMADARHLVALLETGDEIDPVIGKRVFRTRSSADLPRLTPLADWALRARYGAATPGDPIAQIKVTLMDTDPPVWRRLLVPATIRLDRLDRVVQAAMGWTNSHLHMFIHPTGHYGVPDPDLPLHDERKSTLRDLAEREGDTFGYEYDFGDSWDHEVLLEKLTPAVSGGRYPACLAGAGACPPEDCGGTGGYEHLDPARFDTADANRRLDAVVVAATRTS